MAVSIYISRAPQQHFHIHRYNDLNRFEFPVRDNPKCKESVVAWRLTRAELQEVFSEARIDTSTFLSYTCAVPCWHCSGALARSGAPWIRKFSYLPIRENLVTTSAYPVRSYTLWEWGKGITSDSPSGEEYVLAGVKFFISSTSLVSAVNHMVARAFKGKQKTKTKNPSLSFR